MLRTSFFGAVGFVVALLNTNFTNFADEPAKPTWNYAPELLRPFWRGDVVAGESVLFIKDEQTGESRASVLFPVRDVLAVRNSVGDVTYEQGKDFVWKPESREIVLPAGSRIPSRTPQELRRPAKSQKYELTHRDGNGEIFFGGRLEYAEMQTCITYRHAPDLWKSPVPKFDAKALPRSVFKLLNRQTLSIVTLGDSISAGANASALYDAAPYQPAYPELLRRHLEARFRGKVEMTNLAVGGTDTAWGLTQIEKVVAAQPNLVLLAFGMNDSAGRPAKDYQANTKKMIAAIREKLPDCEFILIASMLGNRDWVRLKHEAFPEYRDALKELCEPGIALADLTSIWKGFLELKQDWDQTGNGVNHPNDFGHRVYVQVIATLLDPQGEPVAAVSDANGSDATRDFVLNGALTAAAEPDFGALEKTYSTDVRPLVVRTCAECHSEKLAEAEINLLSFATFGDVRKEVRIWQKVGEMLDSGQMPPPEAKQQLNETERSKLRDWVRRYLKEEAKRFAGDPGPVVLRRLSNAEYTYVLRDLTGVDSLQPAREFPVDGAAGEGFTNAGHALVMSPSLLAKYLDAAKEVAAHAVLLPDGIRFSPSTTRRDWTESLLTEIREFYREFTDGQGGSKVNLQGIVFDTNAGGRLPIEKYFVATLTERDALQRGTKTIEVVATERGLRAKYLEALWKLMTATDSGERGGVSPPVTSLLIDGLRARWKTAKPEDAPALAAEIARWQQALWRFTSVGHIGKVGGPKAWMEPVAPITAKHEMRLKLPAVPEGQDVVLYLSAGDAGDGNEQDVAIWDRPRFVMPGRPDLLLRDVRPVSRELATRRERLFASAAKCLAAVVDVSAAQDAVDVKQLAQKHGVDADALAAWLDYLGIGAGGPATIGTPITRKIENSAGYDFVKGWVGDEALSVVANSSDQHVRIPGNMAPHGVAVHPTPKLSVAVGWRSPAAATLRIEGQVQHAHPECGNGVVWSLELKRGNSRQRLAAGTAQGPNKVKIGPLEKIAVRPGDLVSLVVGPHDGNHSCDLTAIDFTLHDGTREWNLGREISPDILAGNPHKDSHGNADVWHFYSEPANGSAGHVIAAGSVLARWQSAASVEEKLRLADEVQRLLQGGVSSLPKDSPDIALYRQLTSFSGPFFARSLTLRVGPAAEDKQSPDAKKSDKKTPDSESQATGLDPDLFGKHPSGSPVDAASLCVRAPSVIEVRLPADLVAGAEFVTTGSLHAETGQEGSVQFQVLTTKPESAKGLQATAAIETNANGPWTSNNRSVSHTTPIVAMDGSAARRRIEAAFDEFRRWFPAALCYTKIVPVDEVVTLTLFYREDDHLRRLMLNKAETARLDRLWDELHFVSHDSLTLVDALEQLIQYATQDADPKVFEPLRKPFGERADAFRRRLVETEPKHVEAVLEFASRAYRHPLRKTEADGLRALYRSLRDQELPHDEAIRLLLARVLVSPDFLYRPERSPVAPPQESRTATDRISVAGATEVRSVTDDELATRLSFFLWSSVPDAELREVAATKKLHEPETLAAQTRRMSRDARVRRLATEFACQWLHIYDFDNHDEKSTATFPTFNGLRGAMYEESIRFFTDLVQRDGSVLELLDADHTFVNEELAKHYGIPWEKAVEPRPSRSGNEASKGPLPDARGSASWRRVDGIKQHGRGGILGMASTLSKQSGASRTSPILRGNWVSEVLLHEKLPKPPKGVPVLPDVVPDGLTERQLIEKHSSVAACAKCHARIDPFGFSLENFDGIGRSRAAAQPPIDTRTKLLDGTEINGLDGLRSYLLTTRRDDFVRQFCRKLLGYALGRAVELSDEPLLDEIQKQLKQSGYRFSTAVEIIVTSPQFLRIRHSEGKSP